MNRNITLNNYSQVWSEIIIDQLVKMSVKHFFCCPGMRNAPLLRAANNHEDAQIYTGFDERSQSYRALGFIKSSGLPSVLICTSGTAVANFLPAVIEAQKTMLPLIVISADRPGELNCVDANQTINQIEVLRDYTKTFWHLSEPQANYSLKSLAGHLCHCISQATTRPCGPIHLNVPLREPLDLTKQNIDVQTYNEAITILNQDAEQIVFENPLESLGHNQIESILSKITKAKSPLIIFAPLSRNSSNQLSFIKSFIKHYKGNYYCDVETGGKFYFGANERLIPSLDHPEVLLKLSKSKPDLIIHIGQRLTSKHYYTFLSDVSNDCEILQITNSPFHQDPGFSFQKRIICDPLTFIEQISEQMPVAIKPKNNLSSKWSSLIKLKEDIIEEGPLSYPYISKKSIECLTNVKQAFIGNSTFIRSFDSYASPVGKQKTINVFANRGASGIEGNVATALGIYEGSPSPTVLFLGDISLIHDFGSLFTLVNKGIPLLVIVANNSGGGIFNLLPIAKDIKTLPLLTTPHQYEFSKVAKALGFDSTQVDTKQKYNDEITQWNENPKLKFIEVIIDDINNKKVYELLKTVKL
jgi:2-succinyl-5-enolpyruvyl-6-hydroxy-3-cyclohexene-1-carboxylate synthase